ncbi:MAG: DUF5716 family protein [Eubacteriales bacterium]|nr:DUF5716 family protein [Eubacteriales bacterium]
MRMRIIGLDLDFPYSQISIYSEQNREPETLSMSAQEQRFLIPVPEGLYRCVDNGLEKGTVMLTEFIRDALSLVKPLPDPAMVCMMVTMKEMCRPWTEVIRLACEKLGIGQVFLQSHRESFFSYTLHQKKELWQHKVALFEYEDARIMSYVLEIDYGTRPALVQVTPGRVLELGAAGRRSSEDWDRRRDEKFLEMIREMFQGESFSSVFLIGESFDKVWAAESVRFLCKRRHVFQGRNLYTKGACYAACEKAGVQSMTADFLYQSEDMVEMNLSMQLKVRGRQKEHLLVSAGQNWYEAVHTCEILLDDEKELLLYSKSMVDGATASYSIALPDLPKRPPRTTRLEIKIAFRSADHCRITIRDLGFGEFFASSGLVWESELELSEG